jgi:Na+/H+ antiporter NhaD/arsenite permease-like protein
MGTTGASMLLIRPVLRANQHRTRKVHIFVFFIFLVSNIGGSLTPLGDPPLFIGFLAGVDFFWTTTK